MRSLPSGDQNPASIGFEEELLLTGPFISRAHVPDDVTSLIDFRQLLNAGSVVDSHRTLRPTFVGDRRLGGNTATHWKLM